MPTTQFLQIVNQGFTPALPSERADDFLRATSDPSTSNTSETHSHLINRQYGADLLVYRSINSILYKVNAREALPPSIAHPTPLASRGSTRTASSRSGMAFYECHFRTNSNTSASGGHMPLILLGATYQHEASPGSLYPPQALRVRCGAPAGARKYSRRHERWWLPASERQARAKKNDTEPMQNRTKHVGDQPTKPYNSVTRLL